MHSSMKLILLLLVIKGSCQPNKRERQDDIEEPSSSKKPYEQEPNTLIRLERVLQQNKKLSVKLNSIFDCILHFQSRFKSTPFSKKIPQELYQFAQRVVNFRSKAEQVVAEMDSIINTLSSTETEIKTKITLSRDEIQTLTAIVEGYNTDLIGLANDMTEQGMQSLDNNVNGLEQVMENIMFVELIEDAVEAYIFADTLLSL